MTGAGTGRKWVAKHREGGARRSPATGKGLMKRAAFLAIFTPAVTGVLCAQGAASPAAEENAAGLAALLDDANVLWTCLAAFLVFFMQAGFAMVEAGLTRAKNACNILMKNLMDVSTGSLLFWFLGAGIMFGTTAGGWIGTDGFLWNPAEGGSAYNEGASEEFGWAFLIFQTVFCATAATIVSGAVAGRTKFHGYLFYTVGITLLVYPVFGSWAWGSLWKGSGWLEGLGFYDFAGSTVVHSIGGWAALAGAIVVGPRLGKFRDGKARPIPGHSIPLAALGVFILWLGWFGFNAGSTTAVDSNFAYIAVNTNLAAAAGAVGAMAASWLLFTKPDTSFALNGALAGLVAITAGCDALAPVTSIITGFVGGALVVFSVLFFDRIRVDDPVGAVSVHGVCGAWGTLAVGIFSGASTIGAQLAGVAMGFVWGFGASLGVFALIKYTIGLRASPEEELRGLDISEHGMEAYPGFAMEPGRDPVAPGTLSTEAIRETVSVAG